MTLYPDNHNIAILKQHYSHIWSVAILVLRGDLDNIELRGHVLPLDYVCMPKGKVIHLCVSVCVCVYVLCVSRL